MVKNSLFIATFISEKLRWLPAFTSYSIHVQKFAKKLPWSQSNPQNMKLFTTNDKQHTVCCKGINFVGFKVS